MSATDPSPFVLAVSGGADSTYLLDWQARRAKQSRRKLIIAHVNYGLRESSNDDESFVRQLSVKHGLPIKVYRVSDKERATMQNMEGWARKIRYRFFDHVRQSVGQNTFILTAHTADDQAETVLMRLRQSAGFQGLSAMSYQRGNILRPMLGMRAQDVRRRLANRGIAWQEDETNQDLSLERNFIRHQVLPKLEQEDPQIVRMLCDVAELAGLSQKAAVQVARQVQSAEKTVDRATMFDLSSVYRHAAWRDLTGLTGRNGRELQELDRLLLEAKNGSVRPLSNGLIVTFGRDTVHVTWQSNHLPKNQVLQRVVQKNQRQSGNQQSVQRNVVESRVQRAR